MQRTRHADALRLLLTDREERAKAGRASCSTVSFYAVKTGHLTRIFEHDERGTFVPFHLAKAESVSRKLARRAGIRRGAPAEVCPIRFAPEYEPRRRFLAQDQLQRLLGALTHDRAATVAFMVATSVEWGAVCRAERGDIDLNSWRVLVRGTKRTTR